MGFICLIVILITLLVQDTELIREEISMIIKWFLPFRMMRTEKELLLMKMFQEPTTPGLELIGINL